MSMNAALLEEFNTNLKIVKKIKIPNLQPRQVLVKVIYTAICGSQINEINGGRETKKFLPHLLGHEATGLVVGLGSQIKKLKLNDRVILSWIGNNLPISRKPEYEYPNSSKKINSGLISTFSNFTIVSQSKIIKLPKSLNFKIGTLLGCAFPTGSGIILNQTKINKKTKVCIIGLGGVGLSALITAIYKKPFSVHIFDKQITRSLKIKSFMKIFFGVKIYVIEKRNMTRFKEYFDYVIECSGNLNSIENGMNLICARGKLIFASHPPGNKSLKISPYDLIKGKKIEGSWGGNTVFKKNMRQFMKILLKYKKVEKLFFTKTYTLSNINSAIKDMKKGKVLRPLISINNGER